MKSSIRSFVVSSTTRFGPKQAGINLLRVVGTTDCDGNGTKHSITEKMADPWLFVDETVVPYHYAPPFDTHPHCGLVANTVVKNTASMFWDNVNCKTEEEQYGPCWPGGLFQIFSGKGVFHDEGRPCPEEIQRQHPEKRDAVPPPSQTRSLQAWFNPGVHKPEVMKASVETNIVDPSKVPVHTEESGFTARVLLGSYSEQFSPAKTFGASVFLLDCALPASATTDISVAAQDSVWIYNSKDSGKLIIKVGDAEPISLGDQTVVMISPGTSSITVSHAGKSTTAADAQFYIGGGTPWGEKNVPTKLLGMDGALVAIDEHTVRDKLLEAQELGTAGFGK